MVLALYRGYTKGGFKIYPTDVGHTAEKLASACPRHILVYPWGGADTIKPFVDAGVRVSVVGCAGFAHPDACEQVRAVIRAWPFANQLEHVLDCEEWASKRDKFLEFIHSPGLLTS